MRRSTSTNKARHVSFPDQIVTFSLVKDFLGTELVKVKFSNRETTTLSAKRFNELYVVIK